MKQKDVGTVPWQKLLPALPKVVQYMNQIESDHDLEGVSTVLFLMKSMPEQSESQRE